MNILKSFVKSLEINNSTYSKKHFYFNEFNEAIDRARLLNIGATVA